MKQKDIALIIVIVFFSALVSYFVSGKIFVSSSTRSQKTEVVDVINSDFNPPDTKYYNSKSIDPTQLVQVGNNNNQNPFNAPAQP